MQNSSHLTETIRKPEGHILQAAGRLLVDCFKPVQPAGVNLWHLGTHAVQRSAESWSPQIMQPTAGLWGQQPTTWGLGCNLFYTHRVCA